MAFTERRRAEGLTAAGAFGQARRGDGGRVIRHAERLGGRGTAALQLHGARNSCAVPWNVCASRRLSPNVMSVRRSGRRDAQPVEGIEDGHQRRALFSLRRQAIDAHDQKDGP